VLSNPPETFVHVLRVLLDPGRVEGFDDELLWQFDGGATTGLRIRNHVAVPTDGQAAELALLLSLETWADVLSEQTTFDQAVAGGRIRLHGDPARVRRFLASFDHPSLGPVAPT
jgi:alkyl sulfatase BDS1-like metallo-beta-lactamase superfamily hydrolase